MFFVIGFLTVSKMCALALILLLISHTVHAQPLSSAEHSQWTLARASDWSSQFPWIVGFNYVPRTAINQLEMWQEDTFDPVVINQELGWASEIGFNMVRVFLHDLPWQQDSESFLNGLINF